MKIIVFGGAGFLGSYVADTLTDQGHEVTIYDLKESIYLKDGQKVIIGDILDSEKVRSAIEGKDIVYNFAGVADIAESGDDPKKTIITNVEGSINILEACRKGKVKRYIFASTIYVYSDSGSFYRASKQSCELFIESYQKEYGIDFTILRYGSLYGPRSDETNWIQHVIKAALNDGKIVRKGDGEEIREYIHVKDAALLTVKMMDEEYKNQYAVITGQQTMKIKDVLTLINEIMGNKLKIKFVKEGNEGHYEITPYSFKPKFAKKITSNSFVDFGQGILELLDLEYKKGNPHQQ